MPDHLITSDVFNEDGQIKEELFTNLEETIQDINSTLNNVEEFDPSSITRLEELFNILILSQTPIPQILVDGNTVGWWRYDALSTITKDGLNSITKWGDYLASGHDLIVENTESLTPTFDKDGVVFNGIGNRLSAVFSSNQPRMVYSVMKIFSDTPDGSPLYCGSGGGGNCSAYLYGLPSSPELIIEAGGVNTHDSSVTLGNFLVLRTVYNGEDSKIIVNDNTPSIGSVGANNPNGFVLGSNYNLPGGSFGHIQVKEVIVRDVVDTTEDESAIYNYLKSKYNL